MATRMQQRRGTAAQWISTNGGNGPILNPGEIGYETDTNKFKIGDGTNHWINLDYFVDANSIANPSIGSSIVFEGTTENAYETTLFATDPTADRTITLPNATGTVVLADGSGNVTVSGDLAVSGTTTIINSTVLQVQTEVKFEGATANEFETSLKVVDPTADRTITFPDDTGTVALLDTTQTLVNKTINLNANTLNTTLAQLNTAVSDADVASLAGAETLTNKTLTSPRINEDVLLSATSTEINVLDGITSSTQELNILDGVTATAAELNILDGVTSTAAELNILDGVTATAAQINVLASLTSSAAELNILDGVTSTTAELNILDGIIATTAELNILSGVTATALELNILDGVTSTAAELNILDGVTATALELNILDGVTSTAAELNILDGATLSVTELNYVDGVTSDIQTQLNGKQAVVANVSDTEIGYLDGVTSGIQTQIDGKASTSHTHAQSDITNLTTDLAAKANLSGATFTGAVALAADPSTALGAATKQYVDNTASGVIAKPQVLGATTANIDATYSNGTAGVGATLTHNTNGVFPAEAGGASGWAVGKGILVKNQTNKAQNGRYYVSDMGSVSTPYVLTRCTYCDEASEIPGAYIFVQDGTFAGTGWIQVVADPATFVVGTDNIDVFQFSGSGTITAGTNISVDGNQVSVINDPTFSGLVTASASGVAFSDGTQTKQGVSSITPIIQKTDSYTLSSLTERDSLIEVAKATGTTITIPLNSTVAYPVGTSIDILQTSTGQVTIAGTAGVTVNATPGLKLRSQWSSCTLFKRATDTWIVMGDLSA
jgi:hypothetical protein